MKKNLGFSIKFIMPAMIMLILVLILAASPSLRSNGDPKNRPEQKDKECVERKGPHSYWTGTDCDCRKEDGYILSSSLTIARCITFNEYCHFSTPGSVFSGAFNEASKENEDNHNLLKCDCTDGKIIRDKHCACPDDKCSLKDQCIEKPKNTTCNPLSPRGWECKDGFVEGSLPNQTEVQCLTTQQCLALCPTGTIMDATYSLEKKCVCTPLSYK